MAFYQNPPPQAMYNDANQASSYQFPPNLQHQHQQPQHQHQQPPQQHQQQQFFSGPRGYPPQFQSQVPAQGSPPPQQTHNPSFYQPQQLQHQNQPQPQQFPPQQAQQQQQQQQQHQAQQQQSPFQQQNQFAGYGGDVSTSMAPPSSTGPMNINMSAGVTMQPGHAHQRSQQTPAQVHARNNNQQIPFGAQDPSLGGWNTPTPPGSATSKTFFQQPTPSPTKTSNPSVAPTSGQSQMPSSSPQTQGLGLQQAGKPQSTPPQRPVLNPPLSPEDAKRETQRVGVLLDINRALLQSIMHLQQAGRTGALTKPGDQGGQSSPTVSESGEKAGENKDESGEKKKAVSSREYVECMRRVQANLAYLAAIADRAHKPPEKIPPRPAIIDTLPPIPGNQMPESNLTELKDLYKSLKDLYPGVAAAAAGSNPGASTQSTVSISQLPQAANHAQSATPA